MTNNRDRHGNGIILFNVSFILLCNGILEKTLEAFFENAREYVANSSDKIIIFSHFKCFSFPKKCLLFIIML